MIKTLAKITIIEDNGELKIGFNLDMTEESLTKVQNIIGDVAKDIQAYNLTDFKDSIEESIKREKEIINKIIDSIDVDAVVSIPESNKEGVQ